jgi:hypothetical protein
MGLTEIQKQIYDEYQRNLPIFMFVKSLLEKDIKNKGGNDESKTELSALANIKND